MPDCFSHDWYAYTSWENDYTGETNFAQVCIECKAHRLVTVDGIAQ